MEHAIEIVNASEKYSRAPWPLERRTRRWPPFPAIVIATLKRTPVPRSMPPPSRIHQDKALTCGPDHPFIGLKPTNRCPPLASSGTSDNSSIKHPLYPQADASVDRGLENHCAALVRNFAGIGEIVSRRNVVGWTGRLSVVQYARGSVRRATLGPDPFAAAAASSRWAQQGYRVCHVDAVEFEKCCLSVRILVWLVIIPEMHMSAPAGDCTSLSCISPGRPDTDRQRGSARAKGRVPSSSGVKRRCEERVFV